MFRDERRRKQTSGNDKHAEEILVVQSDLNPGVLCYALWGHALGQTCSKFERPFGSDPRLAQNVSVEIGICPVLYPLIASA